MLEESRPCHSLIKRLQSNAALFATTGGSANAYTADFTPDFTLTMDAAFYLRIHATNTGASTLSVDGAAAKNLMKIQGASFVALAPGDVIANGIYQVIRDQTGDRYLVISRIGQAAKGDLPSQVAYEDEANTFTLDQKVQKSGPEIRLNDTTTGGRQAKIINNPNGGTTGTSVNNVQMRTNEADAFDTQQDATQPSWALALHEGSNDRFALYRKPAGGAFGAILTIDNAGKMTAGTVPLARVGVTGNFTTASLASNGTENKTITHGLGTDNVKVLVSGSGGLGGSDTGQWGVAVRRPDGKQSFHSGNSLGVISFNPSTPATGNLTFTVINTSGSAQAITIDYTVLREN